MNYSCLQPLDIPVLNRTVNDIVLNRTVYDPVLNRTVVYIQCDEYHIYTGFTRYIKLIKQGFKHDTSFI